MDLRFYNAHNTGILTCMYKSTLLHLLYVHTHAPPTHAPTHTPHTHLSMPPHTPPNSFFFHCCLGPPLSHGPPTHTSPSLPRTPTLEPLSPPAPPRFSPHTPSHSQFSFPFTPHTFLPPPHSDAHSSFTAVSGLHRATATALPFPAAVHPPG